jgi:hypothetical protein
MGLQHHFVVVVEDGKMFIDDDTTDHKFYDGSVWNSEIHDWEPNYDHAKENETARELLWDKINKENA